VCIEKLLLKVIFNFFVFLENVARLAKSCFLSSSYIFFGFENPCTAAINGRRDGRYVEGICIHTHEKDTTPTYSLDLGAVYKIVAIRIFAGTELLRHNRKYMCS
jgi:hypothetical protein